MFQLSLNCGLCGIEVGRILTRSKRPREANCIYSVPHSGPQCRDALGWCTRVIEGGSGALKQCGKQLLLQQGDGALVRRARISGEAMLGCAGAKLLREALELLGGAESVMVSVGTCGGGIGRH
jgi:hypothetical protein